MGQVSLLAADQIDQCWPWPWPAAARRPRQRAHRRRWPRSYGRYRRATPSSGGNPRDSRRAALTKPDCAPSRCRGRVESRSSASAPEKSAPKRVQRRLVDGVGQDQAVVLIGAHGLFAAAFAPHDDEAATGRGSRRERPSRTACENRRRLRSETISPITSTLTPWRRSVRTCAVGFARGNREIVLARGAIDAAGDDLGAAGEEAQQVDILQDADIALAVMHRDAPFVVLGHQHKS